MSKESIKAGLRALYRSGDVVEIRTWDKHGNTLVGRYKFGPELAKALLWCDESEDKYDIYFVLNPTSLPPCTLASGAATKEPEVAHRRWFLLDCDAKRHTVIGEKLNKKTGAMDPVYSKIATEEEHQRALIVGKAAKKGLEDRGWYGIVMASSGNGVHLLVPIDLPNLLPVGTVDEVPKKLVRDVQRIISTQYSNLPEVRLSVSPTQTGLSELTERRTRKDLRPGN